MKKCYPLFVVFAGCWFIASPSALADSHRPEIKEWAVMEEDEEGEMQKVPYMTLDGILVHELDPAKQPPPRVVTSPQIDTHKGGERGAVGCRGSL